MYNVPESQDGSKGLSRYLKYKEAKSEINNLIKYDKITDVNANYSPTGGIVTSTAEQAFTDHINLSGYRKVLGTLGYQSLGANGTRSSYPNMHAVYVDLSNSSNPFVYFKLHAFRRSDAPSTITNISGATLRTYVLVINN